MYHMLNMDRKHVLRNRDQIVVNGESHGIKEPGPLSVFSCLLDSAEERGQRQELKAVRRKLGGFMQTLGFR